MAAELGARVVAGHEQRQPVAAGEAGQVAHVDGVVDEQRVDLALAQLAGEPRSRALERAARRAPLPLTRRPCRAPRAAARARRGSRPGRCPETVAKHRSPITDTRRHGSRVSTSERWTSTAGSAGDLERVADRPRVVRPRAGVQQDRVGLARAARAGARRTRPRGWSGRSASPSPSSRASRSICCSSSAQRRACRRAADRGGRAGRG